MLGNYGFIALLILVIFLQVKFRFSVNLIVLWLIIFLANYELSWTVTHKTLEFMIFFDFLVYPVLLIGLLIYYLRLCLIKKTNTSQVISFLCLLLTIIVIPLSSVLFRFRFYPTDMYRCLAVLIYIMVILFSRKKIQK